MTSLCRSTYDTLWQNAQLWNLQSPECRTTYPNWKVPATLVRTSVENAPGKVGKASPGKTAEKQPWVSQGPGGMITFPTFLDHILVLSQQNHLRLLLVMRYLVSSYGCCLRDPLQRKSRQENEWKKWLFKAQYMIMHRSNHLPHLSQLFHSVYRATKVTCLPQNAFSNCMLCRTW